ncbi:MAG: efflux RND transporter periplasmic adaptor subunit [Polyangiaceae bacterium]|nr:efflux RND transporter periplasmic adaptor subunit [Polyangiaceae bacterium]
MSARLFIRCVGLIAAAAFTGCHSHADDHGHAHGDGSAHPAEEAEPEPISITKWTDRYELFVEIPPPVDGKPISYHAHVTRIEDFHAVTEGRFVVRYKKGDAVVREHAQVGVKRPGIFVFEGEGLPAGEYAVEMQYEQGGVVDTWDCGTIDVLAKEPPPAPESADVSITFLKESQWKIPFRTAWAEEREVRNQLEMPGIVEPAASDQLTISAPTSGRFLHEPKRTLAIGTKVEKGDVLGSIVPNVEGEDYNKLIFAAEEAAITTKQNDLEIARIEPLVKQGILPEKRLIELRNEAQLLASRLNLAQQRLAAVSGTGKKGLAIKAEMTGLITDLLAKNGDTVESGAALMRLGSSKRLWVRAKTFARGPFDDAVPTALRRDAQKSVDLTALGATFLAAAPLLDPETRVGSWVVDLGAKVDDLPAEIRPGASVVVTARYGEAKTAVTVPEGAVVEIDTRPFVFVQMDGEHFEKRPVSVGSKDAGFIPIWKGVEKGERVVTLGGFDIHLAAVMGTVESHRH